MELNSEEKFKAAHKFLENNELDKAEQIYNELLNAALHQKSNSELLLFYLGTVHMKRGNNALAILLFKEAAARREGFVEAINNLGYIYKNEQLIDKARVCFDTVLELIKAPEYQEHPKEISEYLTNRGSLSVANGTPQEALDYFNRALALDNNNDSAHWNRGLAYLELGDYERGFLDYDYEKRLERAKNRQYTAEPTPDWDGTPGKTIVVYGEQGIGDELMFSSMLPDVIADCNVILDAHPRLANLFRLNFPHIPVYGTRKSKSVPWTQFHQIDAKLAIGTLGKFYRKKLEDFPRQRYLQADPVLVEKYERKLAALGDRAKIGVSWQGGVKSTNLSSRYIVLDKWREIFKLDADFISLQYNGTAAKEVQDFEQQTGFCLNHWPEVLADYDETAGLVSNLDLIISVPQSVVHLAGALGVATWQLCPVRAMWQMGVYGQDMPWYGSVRNYWQETAGEWEPVLTKVKDNLWNLLAQSIAA